VFGEKGQTTTAMQRLGSRFAGIPGIGGLGRRLAAEGAKAGKQGPDEVKKYNDQLRALDKFGLYAAANSSTAMLDPVYAAAIAQELGRRRLTQSIDPTRMATFMDYAQRMGVEQSILNNRPDLVTPRPGETQEQAVARAVRDISPANIGEIDHTVLGDRNTTMPSTEQIAAVLNLTNQHMHKLGEVGDADQIATTRDSLQKILAAGSAGTLTLTSQQQESFHRLDEFIRKSPNWQDLI
jgi:hypothetical protein